MTVAVTDPATNKTSDQSQPVAFTLVAGEKSEPVTAQDHQIKIGSGMQLGED
jgi:hypothetical protein